MHLGLDTVQAKSEAMYFPPSLKQAKYEFDNNILPDDIILGNGKKVHYVNKFKYLGSFITPLLNENYEIDSLDSRKKKGGAPQLTCNNNFVNSIQKILPSMNKQGLLREWIPIAKDETNWKQCIEYYFEYCKNTDYQVESDDENEP